MTVSSPAPPSLLARLRRHWRQGTLGEALAARFGRLPVRARVHWLGAESRGEAVRALSGWARLMLAEAPPGSWILSLGDHDAFHQQLDAALKRSGLAFRSHTPAESDPFNAEQARGLIGVICGYPDSRSMTLAARRLAQHPVFAAVPFEYAAGLDAAAATFRQRDQYRDTFFVSPVLLDEPGPYAIYEESLQRFEQKCGLRDYLDLYQLLKTVVENQVPGDVAEFGSYRGHSGWLIARTLQALGSDKRLYMFDTFETFPRENIGVDYFWSKTHPVDFAEVRSKFKDMPQVTLVQGDFTRTLAESGLNQIALAYIDCDSYRATRYLFEALLPQRLSSRGVLVCEDYGHPALLGNRAAVHESLPAQPGLLRFFSQFSGLYIAVKY